MAHMKVKLEMKGTGRTRWTVRAEHKSASSRVRRAFDNSECLQGLDEHDADEPDWDGALPPGACDCFSCNPSARHCCEDCAPCKLN